MKIASVENSIIVFGDDGKKYKIIENENQFDLLHMANDQWWPSRIRKNCLSDMIKYLENRFLYQEKVEVWNRKYKIGDEIELPNDLSGEISAQAMLNFENEIVFWAKINRGNTDTSYKKYVINNGLYEEYKK